MSGLRTAARELVLLPRNAAVLLLRGYRAVVSPLYGQVCRYYPSCSAYALESVQQHGVLRGGAMSAWRVLRCNPWSRGGVDEVPAPRAGRVPATGFGFARPGREACADHDHYEERTAPAHA